MDAYIAGELSEHDLLKKTDYFQRWKLDYRLYRPILDYAKEHDIPLVALNVPREIVHRVAQSGIAGLSPQERIWIPDSIDRSDDAYRERLRTVFKKHPGQSDFEYFVEAQLVWDEAMAARIADYLKNHPQRQMVVIAGGGHLAYGSGIPRRLQRRMPVNMAIVLQTRDKSATEMRGADYLLVSEKIELPPSGRLGVIVKSEARNGAIIERFTLRSPAREAGLRLNDRIVAIGGQPIRDLIDLRLALQDRQPGDPVTVTVHRDTRSGPGTERRFNVTLREP